MRGRGTCLMWRQTASRDRDTGRYQSHRPSKPFYQIVDEYYPAFAALMAEQGKRNCRPCNGNLEFLQCGRLGMAFYGFAASLATPSTVAQPASRFFLPELRGAADGRKCRLAG
ncbi:hypothetical protein ECZU29_62880 [Escherichia coli]|nr:hypothetical protein ECZU29_62880 [Escherichia coli]